MQETGIGLVVRPSYWAAIGVVTILALVGAPDRSGAASVEGGDESLGLPGTGREVAPAAPLGLPEIPPSDQLPGWSVDLEKLLVTAGFDNVMLLSEQELQQLGDRFTAGWIAPAGDLFGLLYVVPADHPDLTMRAFVDEVDQSCGGKFAGGLGKLDALDDRSIGRAEATCRGDDGALYYDMIFYFTAEGTIGITHVGFDATQQKARDISSGLFEILQSW